MQINPSIFRAYDIRGVYPQEVNADTARMVGGGLAIFLKRKFKTARPVALLGRDLRVSSDTLRRGFIEGFIQSGGDIVDLGVTTTPQAIYTTAVHKHAHAGVMITASHNPAEYNGFKFYLRGGEEIGLQNGLKQIRSLSQKEAGKERKAPKTTLQKKNRVGDVHQGAFEAERYIKRLHRLVPEVSTLRLLVDAGGGSAGKILPSILSHYGLFYKPLHFEPDPDFSERRPNPFDDSVLKLVRREMAGRDFNLGAAFDGDGDRVAFFDENGDWIGTDRIFAILAAKLLDKKPKRKFVFELTHGIFLQHFIEAHGGVFKESKVGGVFIRKVMADTDALLGGELSGHIYHRELFNIDSAVYTMLSLLALMGESQRPISGLVADLSRNSLGQFTIQDVSYADAIKLLEKRFHPHVVSRLDGVTVQFSDWWFNMRTSNTEPVLRLTIEARSREELERRFREVRRAIKI